MNIIKFNVNNFEEKCPARYKGPVVADAQSTLLESSRFIANLAGHESVLEIGQDGAYAYAQNWLMNEAGKGFYLKVDIYYNSQIGYISVRYKGIVIEHTQFALLKNVTLMVNEKGRDRFIETGVKNVHAWARGWLLITSDDLKLIPGLCRATYHPYEADSFVINRCTNEQTAVYELDWCIVTTKGVWFEPEPINESSIESSTLTHRFHDEDIAHSVKSFRVLESIRNYTYCSKLEFSFGSPFIPFARKAQITLPAWRDRVLDLRNYTYNCVKSALTDFKDDKRARSPPGNFTENY